VSGAEPFILQESASLRFVSASDPLIGSLRVGALARAMGAARKLQQEIDQVLKKVREGINSFDDIHSKVCTSCLRAC
jgi:Not1 N-terminal domain, CCR4-Not complex component